MSDQFTRIQILCSCYTQMFHFIFFNVSTIPINLLILRLKSKKSSACSYVFRSRKLYYVCVDLLSLPGAMSEPGLLCFSQKGQHGCENQYKAIYKRTAALTQMREYYRGSNVLLEIDSYKRKFQEIHCRFFKRHWNKTMYQI